MDLKATLTLQIACFLQADASAPTSASQWALVPGPGNGFLSFAEAAAHLSAIPKPVMIGALNFPGHLALWGPSVLDEAGRRRLAHTLANQRTFLDDKLASFGAAESGTIVFEGWGTRIGIPLALLREWLSEYALTWGFTIGPPTDATHQARLGVLNAGRHISPGFISGGCGHEPAPE